MATINRSGGNGTINGSADNDSIKGTGNDTIHGGAGAGSFVIRDGDGSDTITAFNTSEGRIAFDMAEITRYQDVLDRMTQSDNSTCITFDNGQRLFVSDVANASLGPSTFFYSAGPVFLLVGTPIRTERGDIPIEALRPDDILWTKDRGWQALRLVVLETMVFTRRDDPAKPILLPKGALGNNMPYCDLIVSPQHCVLQILPRTREEVLGPAVKLIGQNGVRQMRGKKRAEYLNVVMDYHSIIEAAGCWVESLLVTSRSLSRQTAAARRLLDHAATMTPARRVEPKGARPRHLKTA